ncbi:MAG: hypothetical protein QMC67_11140 [Candidatus Wallbacteria bacterium]
MFFKPKTLHMIKKLILTIFFASVSFTLQGCFSDKGGSAQNSVLNLTPQQQLHGMVKSLETEKVIYDDSKLSSGVTTMERTIKSASGQTKYELVFFNALYKYFNIELMFKKGSFKAKQIFEMVKSSELEVKYFSKSNYRPNEYHLILGLFNSIKNFMRSDETEKRLAYKRACVHFSKLFKKGSFYTSDFKIGGAYLTQNDVRLFQIENEIRYENPIEAFDYLKILDMEDENFCDSAQYKTKKAQLLVIAGEIEEAAKLLVDFKTKKYLRSTYYDEGLWTLKGIYEILYEKDEKYSVDVKVVNNLLKTAGGFYSKGGILKLKEYLPQLSEVQIALFKSAYLYYSSKYNESADIVYDILDYPEAKNRKFKKLDASPDDLVKGHKILIKCYEKMKKDKKKIEEEKELAVLPSDTEEVIIDIDELIKIEKKKRGELEETEEVNLDTKENSLATKEITLSTKELSLSKEKSIKSAAENKLLKKVKSSFKTDLKSSKSTETEETELDNNIKPTEYDMKEELAEPDEE